MAFWSSFLFRSSLWSATRCTSQKSVSNGVKSQADANDTHKQAEKVSSSSSSHHGRQPGEEKRSPPKIPVVAADANVSHEEASSSSAPLDEKATSAFSVSGRAGNARKEVAQSSKTSETTASSGAKSSRALSSLLGPRARAAGGGIHAQSSASLSSSASTGSSSLTFPSASSSRVLRRSGAEERGEVDYFRPGAGNTLVDDRLKYLVIGDGMMAPFMALSLRVHGLQCDLMHFSSTHPSDRGTVVLTPSITQLMGDVLNVSVPSGSVIGRLLVFDHLGNDMCDLDLNEFREKGESPTFFCCDRLKVESALLSLCRVGLHSCHVWSHPGWGGGGGLRGSTTGSGEALGKDSTLSSLSGGAAASSSSAVQLEALPTGGVRVRFTHSGLTQDYLGVICTARNPALIPELTLNNEELQQRAENAEKYRENMTKAPRWMELCVPPLPELGKYEKRFTPGSQEIVEILTPRDAKLTVRPTMLATKLFYHVTMTIPDAAADPTLKSTSTKLFWDEVAQHWTAGVPGYISHTLFRPLFTHLQQHFRKSSALVYGTPFFLLPHWSEGDGRLLRIAHAAHGAAFDAIDVSEAQGFTDCFRLARVLSDSGGGKGCAEDVATFLKQRRLDVLEELEHHSRLLQYGLKERGQLGFMSARFGMKIMRRYKKSWHSLLKNYVTLLPKQLK